MSKFGVKWWHNCYMCKCPLDIYVDNFSGELEFISRIQTYYKFKPVLFLLNISRIKIINLHMRHVCTHCYMIQKTNLQWLPHIRHREISGKRIITKYDEIKPMTENEIYDWFGGFNNFQTRKDVDDYTLDDNKLIGLPGVILMKSSQNF